MQETLLVGAAAGLVAYLMGSVTFAIVVTRLFTGKDIRTMGSGNAGMTNVLRSVGKPAAAFTAAGDILKGVGAVLIAKALFSAFATVDPVYGAYIAAICAVAGHLFPLYFGFKGGKGVSVAAGAAAAIDPVLTLCLLLVFLVIVLTTRIVSLASITVAALYPVGTALYSWYLGRNVLYTTLFAMVIGGAIIVMHRSNIKRLLAGEEYRFGEKK